MAEDKKEEEQQERFVVKVSDMDDKLLLRATSVITNAFERGSKEADIAADIRGRMESDWSGVWNCVIGKSFGSHVLHMTKNYVFGKIYKHHILLWKAGN